MTPNAIVVDIEGTTSSLAFVHETLFPFSRARLAEYFTAHRGELSAIVDRIRAEVGKPELDTEGCIAQLLEWHDADKKIGPLKSLQGMIWAEGFAEGVLKGHVYDDAVAGLRRWHAAEICIYIYSSGSVAAQKLIFGNTEFGDLTPLFSGYFDTAVGAKREAAAYSAIAKAIGLPASEILFLSDVEAELEAAHAAGMAAILLARDGAPEASAFPVTHSFDTIVPEAAVA